MKRRADYSAVAGSTRVLLLAPTGRDASTTCEILTKAGFECQICSDAKALCAEIRAGAGLALLTAEALSPEAMRAIASTLAEQPAWSELPLMVFVGGLEMDRAAQSFAPLGPRAHVTLVDRPIHVKTLISTTRAALRSRLRQYEIRDLLQQLQDRIAERDRLLDRARAHGQRLTGLAEASLAIASALSLEEVLQMITDQARKVLDAHVAVTCIRVEEVGHTRTIRSLSAAPQFEEWKTSFPDEGETALENVSAELQRPMRLEAATMRRHPLGKLFDERFAGSLVAPLLEREGETVGVIALAGKNGAGEAFNDEDLTVLTQLAQMASASVQNARLYREAQEANRAKDDFLATLAHELRTPMTGILGWVQLMKMDGGNKEDAATAVQMIESATRVQARLVEDLLDVSRIIAGKLRIELAPVELGPVVHDVVETFRSRAEEGGVKLETILDEHPLSVYGDETRLHQVIWNLLSNAIKFTPEGGTVRIELRRMESRATISVSDTGRGISPEFLPHVFERFRQADNTTTRQQAGLGLGLAIVRHLVELHSGTIRVESEGLDHGTSFTVTLPLLAVRVAPAELLKLREAADAPRLNDINVLVVDDDGEAGNLVVMVLNALGAEARSVSSVAEAVKMLRRFQPDVIVSDIAMPGEDGYALMRRLREIQPELGREIRAMALTGYGRPEDRTRILSSGFQRYIQKPVEPIELAAAIASMVAE